MKSLPLFSLLTRLTRLTRLILFILLILLTLLTLLVAACSPLLPAAAPTSGPEPISEPITDSAQTPSRPEPIETPDPPESPEVGDEANNREGLPESTILQGSAHLPGSERRHLTVRIWSEVGEPRNRERRVEGCISETPNVCAIPVALPLNARRYGQLDRLLHDVRGMPRCEPQAAERFDRHFAFALETDDEWINYRGSWSGDDSLWSSDLRNDQCKASGRLMRWLAIAFLEL